MAGHRMARVVLRSTDSRTRPANCSGRNGVLRAWATDPSLRGEIEMHLTLPNGTLPNGECRWCLPPNRKRTGGNSCMALRCSSGWQ